MFTAAVFARAKIWKQLKCPGDDWVKKPRCISIEYDSAIKTG